MTLLGFHRYQYIPHTTRTQKVLSQNEFLSIFLRLRVILSYVNIEIKEMQVVLLLKTIAKQAFRDWIKILSENFFTEALFPGKILVAVKNDI